MGRHLAIILGGVGSPSRLGWAEVFADATFIPAKKGGTHIDPTRPTISMVWATGGGRESPPAASQPPRRSGNTPPSTRSRSSAKDRAAGDAKSANARISSLC